MTKVSVLMGMYNCADTLPEAIRSIQAQTFRDWELLLCDDGSTDSTYAVAQAFQQEDRRIRLLRNERNLGLNETLNRCLKEAQGEYIARQDGDDVSLPDRFEKQVAFLDSRPDIALVSGIMLLFDEGGDWGQTHPVAEPMPRDLLPTGAFAHAASMMRKDALNKVGGYSVSPGLIRVEDYHLWYKLYLAGYRGVNLQVPLYRGRDDRQAQARRTFQNRLNEARVRLMIIRDFKLGARYLPTLVRPLAVGLLPGPVYRWLHQRKLGAEGGGKA